MTAGQRPKMDIIRLEREEMLDAGSAGQSVGQGTCDENSIALFQA